MKFNMYKIWFQLLSPDEIYRNSNLTYILNYCSISRYEFKFKNILASMPGFNIIPLLCVVGVSVLMQFYFVFMYD